ncbi:MAG: Re/Si-specific NAD(P)(+) transhydrogenase subunit alpha [Planctomycetota bacterium]|nr:MAG: Re/Si-specific NAD(P)(+) transhydrogenase subunit alpha [Planctomycetota bacterium]
MTVVFVPKETAVGETRVAATPETVAKLAGAGFTVKVEAGAGALAHFPDPAYGEAGAALAADAASCWSGADLVLKVAPPTLEEARRLRQGALLVSFLSPHDNATVLQAIAAAGASAFAMDLVPRVSRAQRMDALSSQANIAGYKAVLLAATQLGKYFPLLMTAAGTVKPARVLVFGAGVAGLQAIATARRLGAVVEATDIRASVKEQVESLGARFVDVGVPPPAEDQSGYAREASDEYRRRQAEVLARHVAAADVVITTAQVPGRRAPLLVSAEMLASMRPGSVIVDLAADQGGNCAGTVAGRTVVEHGVILIGAVNLAASVPVHASELYARNVLAVVTHLAPAGEVHVDLADEINAAAFAVRAGLPAPAGAA